MEIGARVFGATFLVILAGALVPMVLLKSGPVSGAIGGIIFVLVAIVGGSIVLLLLYSRYVLAIPACVLENLKAHPAIKRSVVLTAGNRGRIMVVIILVTIVTFAVMGVLVFPASLLPLMFKTAPLMLVLTLQHLATFIAGTLTGAIATIALSLIYYDERVRKEAFDIQLMMAALDEPPSQASSAAVPNLG